MTPTPGTMRPARLERQLDRRGLLGLGAAAGLGLLTACNPSSSPQSGASSPGASAPAAGFPVTIRHALGTAVVPAEPRRVVTLGQGAAEAAIALGTHPVATENYTWGADADGHLPWVREAYERADKPLPATFPGGEQLDVEAIAAQEPALVLAPWSGLTQKQYDLLSQVCPVVAYEKAPWTTTWDGEIRLVAKALGRPDDGEKVVSELKDTLARAAAAHPQYKDVTFSYIYTQGPGTLGLYMPSEQRVAMVSALGLKVDPVVESLRPKDGSDWSLIGLENADKLSGSDLVFTWYLDAATRRQVTAQPLYASIPAIKRGSVVTSDDPQLVTAMSMINPLTVDWALPRLTSLIDAAIARLEK